MILRGGVAALFVAATAVLALRAAAVEYWADRRPDRAAAVWPAHPDALSSLTMVEVGEAAGSQQPFPQTSRLRLEGILAAQPLATVPFLIEAALAQQAGDQQRSERLLGEARARDPRSTAARFLLADLYLRTGRFEQALDEISALSRFVPGAAAQIAPAIAEFAQAGGSPAQLRQLLRGHPQLKPKILWELSSDPRNADLVLALSEGQGELAPGDPDWRSRLTYGLVEAGQYERALSVWSRLTGVSPDAARGLFNPGFAPSELPPPFSWSFAAGGAGVAEPENGTLRVLFYGREDTGLANQLLLLRQGRYLMSMQVAGDAGSGNALRWVISCLGNGRELLNLPLGPGISARRVTGSFEVPSGDCAAQRLELRGSIQESPRSADLRISGLELDEAGR